MVSSSDLEGKMSSSSVQINFSPDYSDLLLIDVSDEEIRKCFENEEKLEIKGINKFTEACLCTKASTFSLFSKETSNELLLLNGNEIEGCGAHRILEPVKVRPRLDQLKFILEQNVFTPDELHRYDDGDEVEAEVADGEEEHIQNEDFDENFPQAIEGETNRRKRVKGGANHKPKTTTKFEELLLQVQASETEIIGGLKLLGAFEVRKGNGYRILSKSFEERVLKAIINSLIAEEFDVVNDSLQKLKLLEWVSEFPDYIVNAMYDKFVDGEGKLDIKLVQKYQSEAILSKLGRNEMAVDDFASKLEECLPPGGNEFAVSTVIKGIGLLSDDGKRVAYFPTDSLSRDSRKRCEELFCRRTFWSLDELRASLEGVDGGPDQAIQKYARAFTNPKGERGYVKR
jgi:hypothetical protein